MAHRMRAPGTFDQVSPWLFAQSQGFCGPCFLAADYKAAGSACLLLHTGYLNSRSNRNTGQGQGGGGGTATQGVASRATSHLRNSEENSPSATASSQLVWQAYGQRRSLRKTGRGLLETRSLSESISQGLQRLDAVLKVQVRLCWLLAQPQLRVNTRLPAFESTYAHMHVHREVYTRAHKSCSCGKGIDSRDR